MSTRRRTTAFAMFGAGLVVGGVLMLPLMAGLTFAGVDFFRTQIGMLCELQRQLGNSLWLAPHLGGGQPLFADPQAQLLYPFQWIAQLMAPDLGASVAAALQLALATAGATWLLRTHGVKPFASACLGAAFAFSGTALNLIWHASYLSAAAWLPFAWAAARRVLQGSSGTRAPLALFLALAMLLLGAEPMTFAVSVLIIAVEAAARIRRPSSRMRATRAAFRVALLTLAAVGVGLAQWLPASAELALTTRSGALDVHEVLRWSFVAPQWVAAIAPGILQERIQPGTSLWLLWNGPNALAPWNVSPYLGPLLLVSCLLGARHRRSRIACGVFAVSILFSLGEALPMLARLLEAAPFLALFRYPSKLLLPATLAATVAAGIALQRLARHPANERRAFLAVGGVVAGALAAAMAWLILAPGTVDGWASTSPLRESTGAALPTLSSLLASAILQGLAPLLAALALIGVRGKWAALLPGLVFLDLVLAAPTALAVGPRLENLVSPFVDFGPHAVLCHSSEVFKVTVRLNEETGVWSENVTLRALAVPNLNACDGLSGAIGYSVLQTRLNARLEAAVNARSAAATRALGCTHLVARGAPPDEVTRAVASRLDVPLIRISEIADPLPEAFVALRPALVADEKELGERLLSAHGAAATLALADDPLNRLSPGLPLPEGESVSIGRLQRTHASRARLELIGSGGAVVGVRTSFQVGWRAVQAGRALPVIRVGGQHLGAIVADAAAGPIDFEYSPPRLIAGTVAALIGLLLAAGVIAAARKRRQPSAAPDGSSLPDREGGERGQPGE